MGWGENRVQIGEYNVSVPAGVALGRRNFPTQRRTHGTIIRRAIDDRSYGGIGVVATSPSRRVLKATPSASRQLPREGAMYYGTHVVGKSFRPQNSFPCLTILALRQKAPFWPRLRRRRAGSRRRRETEGVAFGHSNAHRPQHPHRYPLKNPGIQHLVSRKKIQKPAKNFKKRLDKRE